MNRSIFHYTTLDGLLGILKSQSMHATHYDYLNDASEGKILGELIVPIFAKEFAEIEEILLEKKILKTEFKETVGKNHAAQQARKMLAAVVRVTDNTSPFFIASFCEHQEGTFEYKHGLLSQWRGYSSSGGFAIEFDESGILKLIEEEKKKFSYSGILAHEVFYTGHANKIDPEKFKGIAKAVLRDFFKSLGHDLSAICGDKDIGDLYVPYVEAAPYLKDHSFAEEREYRIVAICFRPRAINAEDKRVRKSISTRGRRGIVTPYINLFDELRMKLPIKSVIVGPQQNQESQKYSIEVCLEQVGIEVPVRISRIPYRQ